jgi:hypothetical protein
MKNLTTTLTFIFFSFSLFAQYECKGIQISSVFGFPKSEALFYTPATQISTSNTFSLSFEGSYAFNPKLMAGIGYTLINSDFQTEKPISIVLESISAFGTTSKEFYYGSQKIIEKNIQNSVSMHLRYSQRILEKLFINLKFTYFNWRGENTIKASELELRSGNSGIFSPSTEDIYKYNFSEVRFSPSLQFFILKNLGCYVEPLGLSYKFMDSRKSDNSFDRSLNFNFQNVRWGIFYFIQTSKKIK